jgi:hypothetical protein
LNFNGNWQTEVGPKVDLARQIQSIGVAALAGHFGQLLAFFGSFWHFLADFGVFYCEVFCKTVKSIIASG